MRKKSAKSSFLASQSRTDPDILDDEIVRDDRKTGSSNPKPFLG